MEKVRANIEKFLGEMGQIGKTMSGGVTRLPFTPEMKVAQQFIIDSMNEIGLDTYIDASGAVVGRLEGKQKETIIIGSHFDTVENGGNYDGIAGVACGIEVARLIKQQYGNEYPYSIEILATNDEEGARFSGGFFSSKAMFEEWTADELMSNKDRNGISIYDAMKDIGMDPGKLCEAKRDVKNIHSFFEIHIEQGPVLDNTKKEIGIVDTIVGMRRMLVTISGRADHAGTTPMNMRNDSLETAAKIISCVGDCARQYKDTVATVGYIKPVPNAINTIAEKTEFSLDLRSTNKIILNSLENDIFELIQTYSSEYDIKRMVDIEPVKMDNKLIENLVCAAKQKDYIWTMINSGAGHDSLIAGKYVPTAMVFVPSVNGRSHCPEEYTTIDNFVKAINVLFECLKKEEY